MVYYCEGDCQFVQVSPYEVEEAIQLLPEVELCAVIGVPDEYSGQLPKVYIKLRDGARLEKSIVHQLVNSKFPFRAYQNSGETVHLQEHHIDEQLHRMIFGGISYFLTLN